MLSCLDALWLCLSSSVAFFQEVETRLARYLQKGATVEAELLTAFTSLLPEDVKRNLPAELKDILLRGSVRGQVAPTPPTYQEAAAVPIAVVAKNQTGLHLVPGFSCPSPGNP